MYCLRKLFAYFQPSKMPKELEIEKKETKRKKERNKVHYSELSMWDFSHFLFAHLMAECILTSF